MGTLLDFHVEELVEVVGGQVRLWTDATRVGGWGGSVSVPLAQVAGDRRGWRSRRRMTLTSRLVGSTLSGGGVTMSSANDSVGSACEMPVPPP